MSDKDNVGSKCYQMYQIALKDMEGGTPDLASEVIVHLWRTIEFLNEKLDKARIVSEEKECRLEEFHKIELNTAKAIKDAHGSTNILGVLKPFMKNHVY